jgi:hypothetical protein
MRSPSKLIATCLMFLLLAFFSLPTAFCAQKPGVNTSNMAGVLSIGPDGQIYIQFTESHAKFTVGNMIMGKIPEELTVDQADQHELQKAAYKAYNAWLKCEEAKKKAADGKITLLTMEYECTRYNLYNFKEVNIWATAIQDNNLDKEIPFVAPLSEISKFEIEKDNQKLSDLIDRGAEPTAEGYQPPGGEVGFTPPITPINTSEPSVDTRPDILDRLQSREIQPASPSSTSQ